MNIDGIIAKLGDISKLDKPIVVFGDYCLDKYLIIDSDRDEPSIETGIIAYQVESVKRYPGAAGTVCNNLAALGAPVKSIGFYGDDGDGFELKRELERIGADTSDMVCTSELKTCSYVKPMRSQPDGTYVEANRIDIRNFCELPKSVEDELIERINGAVKDAAAIIILDQFTQRNMGTLTDRVREALNQLAKDNSENGPIFYVDSRAFSEEYNNMIVKCNDYEFVQEDCLDESVVITSEQISEKANKRVEETGNIFFVTRGKNGIMIADTNGVSEVSGFKVTGPIDIVGAGDASSAGIVLGLVLGLSKEEAAKLACAVASITIQQIGKTGTATVEQVRERLLSQ